MQYSSVISPSVLESNDTRAEVTELAMIHGS